MEVKDIIEKVRETAYVAGKVAEDMADSAVKKANKTLEATKLSFANFDLKTEIEILYKEIGKMLYQTHRGKEIDTEEIDSKLEEIDYKLDKIEENKKIIKQFKNTNKESRD